MNNIYEKIMIDDIETVQIGCYNDINNLHKYPEELSNKILQKLLKWACQPQNVTPIIIARKKINEINKDWLKCSFLEVAKTCIDFSDDWEYRRLLELIVYAIPELRVEALQLCENSENEDIQEILEDFNEL